MNAAIITQIRTAAVLMKVFLLIFRP